MIALKVKSKTEEEKRKIGYLEILKELSKNLKDELLIFAIFFAIIIVQTSFMMQFSLWLAITLISIYLITIICYLVKKSRETTTEMKRKTEDYIKWKITLPRAFPNPFRVIEKYGEETFPLLHFDITFTIKNYTKKTLMTKMWIESATQAIFFAMTPPKKIKKRRFGILTYEKEVKRSLDDFEEGLISPNQEENFTFHGIYRPKYAFEDFHLRTKIAIKYRIYAESEEGLFRKIYFDTKEKKIEIPFEDIIHETKKKRE